MSKPNYPLAAIVFVVTLSFFTLIALLLSRNNPPPANPSENPEPKQENYNLNFDTNFNQAGSLSQENNHWNLLYQGPEGSTLEVNLIFDSQSRCDIQGQTIDCSDLNVAPDTEAMINGHQTENLVKVVNLAIFTQTSVD